MRVIVSQITRLSLLIFLITTSTCLADVIPFTFASGYFTGAWNDGLNITIQGFNGTTVVDATTIVVSSTIPTLENFNWTGLTKVTFNSFGGTPNPNYRTGSGTHFALDNLTINSTVISFDDIGGSIPNGYQGLNWSNFSVEAASAPPNTGYVAGLISPPNVAFNADGAPANFSSIGSVTGDPHFTTYDGVHYDYQGVGDFLLTRSTVPGDQFDVQIHTTGFSNAGTAVSMMTEAAATLCNHNVTFDIDRASAGGSFVSIDGQSSSLSVDNPVLTADGCGIFELSPKDYQVVWNTGEMLDVTNNGTHLDLSSRLSWIDGLGSVEGLLASDLNPDAWRVTGAASLFDPVPEPGALSLLSIGIGLTGFAMLRRRRPAQAT